MVSISEVVGTRRTIPVFWNRSSFLDVRETLLEIVPQDKIAR